MRKLSQEKCNALKGGSATMVAWVAIMGLGVVLSNLNNFISTLTSTNTSKSSSSYSSGHKSMSSIRMTMLPTRSSINFFG